MNNDQSESSKQESNQRGLGARARDAAEQVKAVAHERVEGARHGADGAREQAARRVRKLGVAVRAVGETMRVDDEPYIADYAQRTSARLDRVARYLSDTDTRDVIADMERFIKRKPGLVAGGAFALGLVTGRFLKSSGAPTSGSERAFVEEDTGVQPKPEPNQAPSLRANPDSQRSRRGASS